MANKKSEKVLNVKNGIMLDFGCGGNKQPNFVGMDKRPLEGVDIVHDIEVFPWPLPDESCLTIVGSHIIEHIKPWLTIDLFNELWRVLKVGGQLALSTPYAGSTGYWQDPTHCNGFTPTTFLYFDPRHFLYNIYKPKPWLIDEGFPVYQLNGNLEIVMKKIPLEVEKNEG
jgi:SAM-dependent methyltransferase